MSTNDLEKRKYFHLIRSRDWAGRESFFLLERDTENAISQDELRRIFFPKGIPEPGISIHWLASNFDGDPVKLWGGEARMVWGLMDGVAVYHDDAEITGVKWS